MVGCVTQIVWTKRWKCDVPNGNSVRIAVIGDDATESLKSSIKQTGEIDDSNDRYADGAAIKS